MGKKNTPFIEDNCETAYEDDYDDFHIDYDYEKRSMNLQRRRERSERRRTRFTYSNVEFDTD